LEGRARGQLPEVQPGEVHGYLPAALIWAIHRAVIVFKRNQRSKALRGSTIEISMPHGRQKPSLTKEGKQRRFRIRSAARAVTADGWIAMEPRWPQRQDERMRPAESGGEREDAERGGQAHRVSTRAKEAQNAVLRGQRETHASQELSCEG
jgi:hypothetical protein